MCAKGAKQAARRKRPAREEHVGNAPAKVPRSKTLRMAEFKADEILLFDPVPAGRNAALQVRAVGVSTPASPCVPRLSPDH